MNTKVLGIIVIAIVLVGGVIMFMNNKKQNKSVTNASPTNVQTQLSEKPTVMTKKEYTLDDVAEHASETDCWLAIEGKVYNVTDFIAKHPGGKAILNGCGKDATTLFNERPTNDKGPHPETAKAQLEQLYIGELSE
jgi:cytochrome b involved in lipid metabolism